MSTEAQFFAFSGAVLLLGPKSPPPVSPQPGVRRNFVNLVEAAVAYVNVGERAAFDVEWSPRMGVSWSGVKTSCIHLTVEKSPPTILGCARIAS